MDPDITKEEFIACLEAKKKLERAAIRSLYPYVWIHGIKTKVDLLNIISIDDDIENGSIEFVGEEYCCGSTDYYGVELPIRFVYDMEYRKQLEIEAIEKLRSEEIEEEKAKREAATTKEKRERALYESLKAKFESVEK